MQNNQKIPATISFCTVCRDRLEHLRQTLPVNLKLIENVPSSEIVLLDYNSTEPVQDWILKTFPYQLQSGKLSFYRTSEPAYFAFSHSKNIAHLLAKGSFVSNLDADNFMAPAYITFISNCLAELTNPFATYFHGAGIGSRIGLFKTDFLRLGGYNEAIATGWGYEDSELIGRIRLAQMKTISTLNTSLLGNTIAHSDELRTKHMQSALLRPAALVNFKTIQDTLKGGNPTVNVGKEWGCTRVQKSKMESPLKISSAIFEQSSKSTNLYR